MREPDPQEGSLEGGSQVDVAGQSSRATPPFATDLAQGTSAPIELVSHGMASLRIRRRCHDMVRLNINKYHRQHSKAPDDDSDAL
eukprot:CAMPEP_0180428108 /NCGR_PEP_ID=MMETSP1036_2-20121128/6663_1 /TAXON_ID=632150 /ORGANISM="Azadinium spinosum, Strain 3D9" /LENGTH=84 /DNA_ID=CAMNT_0022433727 /DNA_START=427 /DNA_END=682 /DNA_ORIENTATION=+